MSDVFFLLGDALSACGLSQKLECVARLEAFRQAGELEYRPGSAPAAPREPEGGAARRAPPGAAGGFIPPKAGRPDRPQLVPPSKLPQRSLATPEGHAALIHALAHIEFTAINLALDHALRFPEMPREYLDDWIRIADEERQHFLLLRGHLQSLGRDYGDFDAHEGLWQTAQQTAHDCLVRMAVVPRILEARGLDVNPGIRARLSGQGDEAGALILDRILEDEIGHVAAGDRWFRHLCAERGLEPMATFRRIAADHGLTATRGPVNVAARRAAGFSVEEL